jgi:hypothetical protein
MQRDNAEIGYAGKPILMRQQNKVEHHRRN